MWGLVISNLNHLKTTSSFDLMVLDVVKNSSIQHTKSFSYQLGDKMICNPYCTSHCS